MSSESREAIWEAWAPPGAVWSRWVKPVLFAHMTPFVVDGDERSPADVTWAPQLGSKVALVVDLPCEERGPGSAWQRPAIAQCRCTTLSAADVPRPPDDDGGRCGDRS